MGDSLLFGYSVEESEDKFVITLAGKLAVPIMQDIAANIGSNARGTGRLTSMFPYSLLASHAVGMAGQTHAARGGEVEADLADIFGQGFDRDLDDFERHLERYRSILPSGVVIAQAPDTRPPGSEFDIEDKIKPRGAAKS